MLRQIALETEQDSTPDNSRCYQGGSHASLTALWESVWRLMMSVTCGENSQGSFARLDRSGHWEKTYMGYSQVKMDGSLDEFSGIWPKWGIVSDGAAIQPHGLEPYIDESGFLLLPTPKASDGTAAGYSNKNNLQVCLHRLFQRENNKTQRTIYYLLYNGATWSQCAEYYEMMMGVPKGWTDLNASETP